MSNLLNSINANASNTKATLLSSSDCPRSSRCEAARFLKDAAVVRKTKGVVKASDGIPYIRRGAQNLPVDTAPKLALLERNKGITSFENESVSIDLPIVCNSETVIKFILDVVPTSEPETWLRKQELIKDDKPTVAGVVLFSATCRRRYCRSEPVSRSTGTKQARRKEPEIRWWVIPSVSRAVPTM